VGGKNSLPTKSLAATLEAEGSSQIRTYIQSGNVVFEAERHLGVDATARNWRTVSALLEMAH
jgi:uncharacterized protein (DUF1697 family)